MGRRNGRMTSKLMNVSQSLLHGAGAAVCPGGSGCPCALHAHDGEFNAARTSPATETASGDYASERVACSHAWNSLSLVNARRSVSVTMYSCVLSRNSA